MHNFLIEIWNPYNAFIHGFYRRNKNLVKEVGDEHLIASLKKMVEKCPPILLDDAIVLDVLCGLLTEINALSRNFSRDTAKQ